MKISKLQISDNLHTNKRSIGEFNNVFKVVNLSNLDISKQFRINLTDPTGCMFLVFAELNLTAQICHIELMYFSHSKTKSFANLHIDQQRFVQNLSK